MRFEKTDDQMTVFLNGEIDHHNAPSIREITDTEFIKNRPSLLILNFSEVSFMDSSGVGLVIGRYALAEKYGCKTAVEGLKDRDRKILMMSGLQNKIEFR